MSRVSDGVRPGSDPVYGFQQAFLDGIVVFGE